jgi:hypothetical protein
MDIFTTVGTALRHCIDISAVVNKHFPTHTSFVAWRDAGSHCPVGLLENREDLEYALEEIALRRGGKRISSGIVQFDDQITADRFREWCRPE